MEFVGRKLWVCRNETTGFSVGNFNFGPGPKMKTSTSDLAPTLKKEINEVDFLFLLL